MGFSDAVSSVLGQYASFSGHARRSEYWLWALSSFIVAIVASIINLVIGNQIASVVVVLALLLPNLSVGVRRLHDTGRSGFWWFIGFIPLIGGIVLLVFYVQDSHPPNQYGPSPKGIGAGGPEYGTGQPGY